MYTILRTRDKRVLYKCNIQISPLVFDPARLLSIGLLHSLNRSMCAAIFPHETTTTGCLGFFLHTSSMPLALRALTRKRPRLLSQCTYIVLWWLSLSVSHQFATHEIYCCIHKQKESSGSVQIYSLYSTCNAKMSMYTLHSLHYVQLMSASV